MSNNNYTFREQLNSKHIYIIELEDDKYYVGVTSNFKKRKEAHLSGDGSVWTDEYEPQKFHIVSKNVPNWKEVEDNLTLALMKMYGWQNVRGGSWCNLNMRSPPKALQSTTSQSSGLTCQQEAHHERPITEVYHSHH